MQYSARSLAAHSFFDATLEYKVITSGYESEPVLSLSAIAEDRINSTIRWLTV
jgi:hypothetical protein